MRPQDSFHYKGIYNVVSLSVTLMISIAQAHAFEQGNKRTGFTSGLAFLYDNGYFAADDDLVISEVFTSAVIGTPGAETDLEIIIATAAYEI